MLYDADCDPNTHANRSSEPKVFSDPVVEVREVKELDTREDMGSEFLLYNPSGLTHQAAWYPFVRDEPQSGTDELDQRPTKRRQATMQ